MRESFGLCVKFGMAFAGAKIGWPTLLVVYRKLIFYPLNFSEGEIKYSFLFINHLEGVWKMKIWTLKMPLWKAYLYRASKKPVPYVFGKAKK